MQSSCVKRSNQACFLITCELFCGAMEPIII